MNLKHTLGIFLFLIISYSSSFYAQSPDDFICFFEDQGPNPINSSDCSYNGNTHTPEGTLRILVVFAGFEGWEGNIENPTGSQPPLNGWINHENISNSYQLPYYINYNEQTGDITMDEFMYTDENDLQPNSIDLSTNISNTMYLMSRPNREFKVIGSVFSDPYGKPRQVVIPTTGLSNWAGANRRVAEEMMDIWVNEGSNQQALDYFSQFDQRENNPEYAFSNVNSVPDDIIDVVAYIWRYNRDWSQQPIVNMPNWTGSGGGYFSSALTYPSNAINGFQFHNGFLGALGAGLPTKLFLHEFGHSLFDAPHNCGANGVSGQHFPIGHTGTGLASTNVPIFHPMMAAWERWHLNFISPSEPESMDGTYLFTINDFVFTGDAIRVPLPFPEGTDNQYLWIENHAKLHPLDEHIFAGSNMNLSGQNDPEHIVTNNNSGIYMYVEDMAEDCNDTNLRANAGDMYMINPQGNWDIYRNTNETQTENGWQAKMFPYEYIRENPISGTNPWFKYRADTDSNFPGINHNPNTNAAGSTNPNEGDFIYREQLDDGLYYHTYRTFGVHGNTSNSTAFQAGDKLNMGTNPTILNYPDYNEGLQQVEPYILNGLAVSILSSGAQAQVEIRYKQTEIDNDVLWTGDIILPDITQDNSFDLVLAESRKITLDLSKTPHRESINPITNDYVNPSKLTIRFDAKLHLLENAIITVKGGSTLIIEDGAEVLLEDKACILVEQDGILELKGNNFHLNGKDAVIIVKGKLITADGVDFTFTGPGYADFHSTHTLEMGNGSNFVLERSESTPEFGTRFLRLRDNTALNIEDRIISLQGGIVYYDNEAKLMATNSEVIFNQVKCTDLDNPLASNYNSIGLSGVNLTSCNIENSTFEYFEKGVMLTGNTSIPYFENNNFTRNRQGLVADNMDMLILKDNGFFYNFADGVNLQFIDIAKFHGNRITNSVNGCNFKNVTFAHLVGTHISQCTSNGVLAEKTNVLLKNDGEILSNNVGVQFINNSTATYMLSVGKCGCAKIINNNVGVKGNNIILDIDRIEHEFECNIFPLEPSRFDGNTTIFDICYSTTTSPYSLGILMRGNYWGGGAIGTNYNIKNGTLCTGDNVTINASEYATSYGDCESPGIVTDTPSNFPPGLEGDIRCEIFEVHKQSRLAYYDFHHEDFINAETKYTPVSNLNVAVINNPICVNKIHIARCIVDAIQNDQYTTPNSYWLDSAQRPTHLSDLEITVYPNPTSGSFTAYSEKNRVYRLQIFNILGELIKTVEFAREAEINIDQLKNGLYILQFNTTDGVKVQVEKLMVE